MTPTRQPGYFGPPAHRHPDEDMVLTPVGFKCLLCGEAIELGDTGTVNAGGEISHYECNLHSVIGSVLHQMKQCLHYGGKLEDPEGMTVRQASIAAAELFHAGGILKVQDLAGAKAATFSIAEGWWDGQLDIIEDALNDRRKATIEDATL